MKYSTRVKPIGYQKADGSKVVCNPSEDFRTLMNAQHGEGKADITRRGDLMSELQRRLKQFERTRVAFRAEDVYRYFVALANGKDSARPKPVKL